MIVAKEMVRTMICITIEPDVLVIHSIFEKLDYGLGSIGLVLRGKPPLFIISDKHTKADMRMVVAKQMVMTMFVHHLSHIFSLTITFSES